MTFKRKHGFATQGKGRPRVYRSWMGMNLRCNSPTSQDFDRYGARGIKICERWKDFENFLADMGEPPHGHTLDRIDNSGNYEPSNCRWATAKEQAGNRRNNIWIEHNGVSRLVSDWAASLGLDRGAIMRRIRSGWPTDLAVTTPKVHRWWRGERMDSETHHQLMQNRWKAKETT